MRNKWIAFCCALLFICFCFLLVIVFGFAFRRKIFPLAPTTASSTPTPVAQFFATATLLPTEIPLQPSVTPTATEILESPTPEPTPLPLAISRLAMFSLDDGWAITLDNKIIHTTSGPSSWQDVTPPDTSTGRVLLAAAFIDSKTAVVGFDSADGDKVNIYRTTDGGVIWKASDPVVKPEASAGGSVLVQLYFSDTQHGWMLLQLYPGMFHVYSSIMATKDGGASWEVVKTPSMDLVSGDEILSGSYDTTFGDQIMAFPTSQIGFFSNGDLLKTTDAGKTWKVVTLPNLPPAPAQDAYIYVEPARFTSTKDGAFLRRIDDWQNVDNPPGDIFHEIPQVLSVYVTHNSGQTWTPYPAPAKIGTLFFLNGQIGWFLGKGDPDPAVGSQLFITHNSGLGWSKVGSVSTLPLGSTLFFVDQQNGFAYNPYAGPGHLENPYVAYDSRGGENAYLYQTSDGGVTWNEVNISVTPP